MPLTGSQRGRHADRAAQRIGVVNEYVESSTYKIQCKRVAGCRSERLGEDGAILRTEHRPGFQSNGGWPQIRRIRDEHVVIYAVERKSLTDVSDGEGGAISQH